MFGIKCSLPMQLVGVIVAVFLFGDYIPTDFMRYFYTFSLIFKEFLAFSLPFIIFSFVVVGILSFKKNAPLVLTIMVALIFLSNAIVAMLTYFVGSALVPFIAHNMSTETLLLQADTQPYFTFAFPELIRFRSEHALIVAIVVGILLSLVPMPHVERVVRGIKELIGVFLNRCFIPLLPFYVFGFLLEIQHKGVFGHLFMHYGSTCILIVAVQLLFIFLYYLLAAGGSFKGAMRYIMHAMPSYITAFSTMSSTTTVPVSIECAEKNIHNKPLAEISMPIMANIHLLGDSVGTPLLALVSLMLFTGQLPSLASYSVFVGYFCLAMLAVSGIPGGGIIVMIPILVSQFGFEQQMISIITALYLLLDPFGTAANVMGDGALVIVLHKLLKKLRLV